MIKEHYSLSRSFFVFFLHLLPAVVFRADRCRRFFFFFSTFSKCPCVNCNKSRAATFFVTFGLNKKTQFQKYFFYFRLVEILKEGNPVPRRPQWRFLRSVCTFVQPTVRSNQRANRKNEIKKREEWTERGEKKNIFKRDQKVLISLISVFNILCFGPSCYWPDTTVEVDKSRPSATQM